MSALESCEYKPTLSVSDDRDTLKMGVAHSSGKDPIPLVARGKLRPAELRKGYG
jgi:hypothetical protein